MDWGKGITISIILFMIFILFMVFKATQTNPDLYAEDYYAKEVGYQATIDAISNGKKLSSGLEIISSETALLFSFPEELTDSDVQGNINFYRPENASFDREIPLILEGNKQVIDRSILVVGNYTVKAIFTLNSRQYQLEQELKIN